MTSSKCGRALRPLAGDPPLFTFFFGASRGIKVKKSQTKGRIKSTIEYITERFWHLPARDTPLSLNLAFVIWFTLLLYFIGIVGHILTRCNESSCICCTSGVPNILLQPVN